MKNGQTGTNKRIILLMKSKVAFEGTLVVRRVFLPDIQGFRPIGNCLGGRPLTTSV